MLLRGQMPESFGTGTIIPFLTDMLVMLILLITTWKFL